MHASVDKRYFADGRGGGLPGRRPVIWWATSITPTAIIASPDTRETVNNGRVPATTRAPTPA
jgi:hypothetical protein